MKLKPLILLILFIAQLLPNLGMAANCCQELVQFGDENDVEEHFCCMDNDGDTAPILPLDEKNCCGDDCHCITTGPTFTIDEHSQSSISAVSYISEQNHLYLEMIGNNYIDNLLHPPKV